MKKFLCILLLLIMLLSFASCEKREYNESYVYDGSSLIGLWREDDFEDSFYQLYGFFDDGTVVCTTNTYGINLQTLPGEYEIEGNNTLVVTYNDGAIERNPFSITDTGRLIICYLNGREVEEMALVPFDLEYKDDGGALVGKWVRTDDPSKYFIFNADYTGETIGANGINALTYSTKEGKLYMILEAVSGIKDGVMSLNYTIENGTLTISGEDYDGNEFSQTFVKGE